MCLHCKADGVFDAQKAIKQAVEDYCKRTTRLEAAEFKPAFIERLAKDSYTAKTELRNFFSQSPNWNEELQAVVITSDRTPEPNYDSIEKKINEILMPLAEEYDAEKFYQILRASKVFSRPNEHCDYRFYVDALNRVAPKAYKEDRKITRIFSAFCAALGLPDKISDENKKHEFNHNVAIIAGELTPPKENFKLYASINPAHFLTMSNPHSKAMHSCHSLDCPGTIGAKNGCTGYARDKYSFIVFTVADDNNPADFNNRKTNRQIFAYKPYNGVLLQSRLYSTNSGGSYGGVDGDTAEGKLYRAIIQRELSALENVQNIWDTCNYYDNKFDIEISKGKGFGGYADWLEYRDCAKISIRTDKFYPLGGFSVGAKGLCIECGKEISNGLYCGGKRCKHDAVYYKCCECGEDFCSDEIYEIQDSNGVPLFICSNCLSTSEIYYECADCGEVHRLADMTIIADNWAVCERCLEENYGFCEVCQEWERLDDMEWIESEERYVCADCLRDSGDYARCDECGNWYSVRDMYQVGYDNYVCEDCRENGYEYCEICGLWHEREYMIYIEEEDRYFCEDCLEQSDEYARCENCGEWHRAENMTPDAYEDYICESCLAEYYSYCESCGEYYNNALVTTVAVNSDGEEIYICDHCKRDYYSEICEECGRHFHADNDEIFCAACENSEEGEIA